MKGELLPIGSVVLLNGGTKKVMVSGYYSKNENDDKVYTYNGCIFPEGFMENVFCLFDQSQIDEVVYKGYENENFKKYVNTVMPDKKVYTVRSGDSSVNVDGAKKARIPERAPKHPMSKSEMLSKFGVARESEID